jgi:hypothetical protein
MRNLLYERTDKRLSSILTAVAAAGLVTTLFACGGRESNVQSDVDILTEGELTETSPLTASFEEAAEENDVPVDLLKALAYAQTALEGAAGDVEFEGQAPAFGLFGLRGAQLERAQAISGHRLDDMMGDVSKDVAVGAALLRTLADEAGLTAEQRKDPLAWKPALMLFSDVGEDLREQFANDVLRHLRGVAVAMPDGTNLIIRKHLEGGEEQEQEGAFATSGEGLGQAGAIWRPSANYSSRAGHTPHLVIIHTCEGGYWGCVDWLRQSVSGVSAHYVVKEDGGEISQLVDENAKAWHVGANYRDWLNENSHPELQGLPTNNISIGIEHGGFARQSSWPQGQINASVNLVRGITARFNIPRDRYHIVAHGRLQPESRVDPGPNWPWSSYLAAIAQGSTTPPPSGGSTPTVITVDNTDSARFRVSGNWNTSSWASGRVGSNYRYRNPAQLSDPADYKFNITDAGNYEVFVRVPGNGYSTDAPYVIHHRGGRAVVRKNISARGASWVSLGTYAFDAKDDWIVQISCWTTGTGYVIADAVKLERR